MSAGQPEEKRKIRVAVIFGGQSDEHDVSLRSAETVMSALDPAEYEVVKIGITRDGHWLTQGDPLAELAAASPMFHLSDGQSVAPAPTGSSSALAMPSLEQEQIDIVFPVLHGPMGEDGTIQGLFELIGVPYVGSGVLGSAVAMDKAVTRKLLEAHGIDLAAWILVSRSEWRDDQAAVGEDLAGVAAVAFLELLGHGCLLALLEVGQQAGADEEHAQGHPPHPAAQPKNDRANHQGPGRARLGQGTAPIGQKGDEQAEDQTR